MRGDKFDVLEAELKVGFEGPSRYGYEQAVELKRLIEGWLAQQHRPLFSKGARVRVTGDGSVWHNGRQLRHDLSVGDVGRVESLSTPTETAFLGEPSYGIRSEGRLQWVRQGDLEAAPEPEPEPAVDPVKVPLSGRRCECGRRLSL